jgi:hypothetical protein
VVTFRYKHSSQLRYSLSLSETLHRNLASLTKARQLSQGPGSD